MSFKYSDEEEFDTPYLVLVVDDEPQVRKALKWMLYSNKYNVVECSDAKAAISALEQHEDEVDIVVTDINMPEISGLKLMELVKTSYTAEVILLTGQGSVKGAVEAIQAGAFDYLTKPLDSVEECVGRITQAGRMRRLKKENLSLKKSSKRTDNQGKDSIWYSLNPAMQKILKQLQQVSQFDTPVTLKGARGVGKSKLAQAIHQNSRRKDEELITIHGASVSDDDALLRLFGADGGVKGILNHAHGGTFIIKEAHRLPLVVQELLAVALETKSYTPQGSITPHSLDVRMIHITSENIADLLRDGKLSEALFYQLRGIEVFIPPLSQRAQDIPSLARIMYHRICVRLETSPRQMSVDFITALRRRTWSGNLRELETTLELIAITSTDGDLSADELAENTEEAIHVPTQSIEPTAQGSQLVIKHLERLEDLIDLSLSFQEAMTPIEDQLRHYYLSQILKREGSVSAAARFAKLDRSNFRRLLKRYGVITL
jgi:DNA-binding NtrC family response regulator